jgi:hypothetical protein
VANPPAAPAGPATTTALPRTGPALRFTRPLAGFRYRGAKFDASGTKTRHRTPFIRPLTTCSSPAAEQPASQPRSGRIGAGSAQLSPDRPGAGMNQCGLARGRPGSVRVGRVGSGEPIRADPSPWNSTNPADTAVAARRRASSRTARPPLVPPIMPDTPRKSIPRGTTDALAVRSLPHATKSSSHTGG